MVMAMAIPGRSVSTFGLTAPTDNREWGLVESGSERFLAQDGVRLMPVLELPLVGLHNAANALAPRAMPCRGLLSTLIEALHHFRVCRTGWKKSPKSVGDLLTTQRHQCGATVRKSPVARGRW